VLETVDAKEGGTRAGAALFRILWRMLHVPCILYDISPLTVTSPSIISRSPMVQSSDHFSSFEPHTLLKHAIYRAYVAMPSQMEALKRDLSRFRIPGGREFRYKFPPLARD
jgi:hypothetical protein